MALAAQRRLHLASALLAFVVGAMALSFCVATSNFAVADPAKTTRTKDVLTMAKVEGDESRAMFARYFASESNRAMFAVLGPLQVAGCAGAFLLAFTSARGLARGKLARALLAGCFALSIALAPLVPMMIRKGRLIDFTSRASGDPPEVRSFLALHGAYMAGDLLLLLCAAALVPLLAAASANPDRGERS